MDLIFMGTPEFSAGILEELIGAGHRIKLAVTNPDKENGRKKVLTPPPVKEVAMKYRIPLLQCRRIKDEKNIEEVLRYKADCAVVAAFGQIIPKEILEAYPYGCINVHASILPEYRGAAPIQWAIIDGRDKTGVSIMQMDEGLDMGDILEIRQVDINENETADSLFERLSRLGAETLIDTLENIEEKRKGAKKQPEVSPTPYARMITKQDGLIDWSRGAVEIERKIRGLNSNPGAYTFLEGKSLKIFRAGVVDLESETEPGFVVKADKDSLVVQTGEKCLSIEELQLQSKNKMDVKSFLMGNKIPLGACFTEA